MAVSGGFRLVPVPQASPWLRFLSPLIKPGVRFSRTRLSDWLGRTGMRPDTTGVLQQKNAELAMDLPLGEAIASVAKGPCDAAVRRCRTLSQT